MMCILGIYRMSITVFKREHRENLSKIELLIEFTHTERKFTAKILRVIQFLYVHPSIVVIVIL